MLENRSNYLQQIFDEKASIKFWGKKVIKCFQESFFFNIITDSSSLEFKIAKIFRFVVVPLMQPNTCLRM